MPVDTKQHTITSTDTESTPEANVPVGIRIPRRMLLVAKTMWMAGGDRYLTMCQELLEAELLDRAEMSHEFVTAFNTDSEPPDFPGPMPAPPEELQQITLKLSAEAYKIAKRIALVVGSVPKVCEPLLNAALEENREKAYNEMLAMMKELKAD